MIDVARYAMDGVLCGLEVLPPAQALRIGGHCLRRGKRAESLLHALAAQPALIAAVGAVLGADLMVRNADVFIKLPGCEGRIDWHLDTSVPWPDCAGMANLWVALSHSGPDSGGVTYLPGQHRTPLTDGPKDRDHLTLSETARAGLPTHNAICPTLSPGQATLHAFSTPHRSGANGSTVPRVGLVLRYIDAGIAQEVAECGQGFLVSGQARGTIGQRTDFPVGWHIMR
ncbi:MAG: ectoine hydroxylase-related dioxygenase (phytanoyl-CoA dioxygenase family) [Myxococcota bacterium]|jgi:ectoine hydroxylase-related dioxygenase (phytanoyl-CoA dioxygenase family)